jgi:hypothetical protein
VFEYHSWITIRASPSDDDEDRRLAGLVDELRVSIEAMASPYLLDLRWMNGELFIRLGGFHNHRATTWAALRELFGHVGTVASGSYGLLHVRDDEDPGFDHEVRVLRLVRGTLTEHTEPLLSPCIPSLEDAGD